MKYLCPCGVLCYIHAAHMIVGDSQRLYRVPLSLWDPVLQVARKIVGGLLQKITYNDWLPLILDSGRRANHGLRPLPAGQQSNFYNPNVDATIRNVFATAAFRFGHSLIRTTMSQVGGNGDGFSLIRTPCPR